MNDALTTLSKAGVLIWLDDLSQEDDGVTAFDHARQQLGAQLAATSGAQTASPQGS